MELWIPFTIAAAFFQNLRSAMQKNLQGKLSTAAASYVRFIYALPVAIIYFCAIVYFSDTGLPEINRAFLGYAFFGGLCQIIFTFFLLWLFSFHNFAVGTTFSKLEVVMVAIFGLLLLGDRITPLATVAIAISAIGLLVLTAGQAKLSWSSIAGSLWRKPTLIGLSCAAWLGASVVLFRAASLSLASDSYLMASSFTLLIVLIIQTLVMGSYMAIREAGELRKVFVYWKPASLVGLCGGLTSIGWFTAFTLQNATYVRALGQIELLFTFAATVLFFKEKITRLELIGIVMISASIGLLLLAR
ncbi:MAG: drug/metabolite transporter (DMT)-like permease [Planctomycetota bacterium]|jgi:drug/metabolite transporter (DMT)-like permease